VVLGLAGLLALGAAVLVGVESWGGSEDPGALTRQEYPVGERPPAPAIAGETLDGDRLDLADLRGQVVVVNVWGSWCGPCRAEMPELEEVYQATKELGVSFVGINIRDDRDRAISFAASRVTYPSIFDPASEYALGFQEPPAPIGPPATLVIDRDGNVAGYFYRVVGRSELERVVTGVAEEEPA
jgi:thiol-disulfide isomerase/thioredoxin